MLGGSSGSLESCSCEQGDLFPLGVLRRPVARSVARNCRSAVVHGGRMHTWRTALDCLHNWFSVISDPGLARPGYANPP